MSSSIVNAAKKKMVEPVDFIISELQHSSKPNIIIEGPADLPIYQRLVGSLGIFDIDYHVADGRNNLLAIYKRRAEFSHKSVAFIADKDMWVFTEVPVEYNHIIFTEGYSIENDLYVIGELEKWLDDHQKPSYCRIVRQICTWMAFEVEEFVAARPHFVDKHLNEIIPPRSEALNTDFLNRRGFRDPGSKMIADITDEYDRKLRGKLLFDLLIRFLKDSNPPLKIDHRGLSRVALCSKESCSLLEELQNQVKEKIPELKSSSISGIAKVVSRKYGTSGVDMNI